MMMIATALLLACVCALAAARPIPTIAETFCVRTVEADTTTPPSPPVLKQLICKDVPNRRHVMIGDGPLVHGHLEQLTLCADPFGYELDVGGVPLQCTNTSLPSNDGLCDFSVPFWSFPANASFTGADANVTSDVCAGACDRWVYWEQGEEYAFWASPAPLPPTPVRIAKIFTAVKGYTLWHIDWLAFTTQVPDAPFVPPSGLPPCTPGRRAQNKESVAVPRWRRRM